MNSTSATPRRCQTTSDIQFIPPGLSLRQMDVGNRVPAGTMIFALWALISSRVQVTSSISPDDETCTDCATMTPAAVRRLITYLGCAMGACHIRYLITSRQNQLRKKD
ncbi:hypothetical protein [Methylobacterium sp.]|uniref:hypothetical protein n=1 Tax=Methylobacterium sp. TaxID=409 RepID=UPI0025867463|nr:hypothetical protein [Methylobacterium sp.]